MSCCAARERLRTVRFAAARELSVEVIGGERRECM
jgi:hypothetical protein